MLKNTGWKGYFSRKILDRGEEYFNNDAVDELEYNASDSTYSAVVFGSELYDVTICMPDNNSGFSASCTCPYAEDGKYCKHMAAVCFAIEDREADEKEAEDFCEADNESIKSIKANHPGLREIIWTMPEEEARNLLYKYASENREFRDRIMFKANKKLPAAQKKIWKQELKSLTREYSDRHGFIDYNRALSFYDDAEKQLRKYYAILRENEFWEDASDVICDAYSVINSAFADDSDGGLSFFNQECMKFWTETIPHLSAKSQTKLYHWMISEDWSSYAYDTFELPELIRESIQHIDEKIEYALSNDSYILSHLVVRRCQLMERLGMSADEISDFRQGFPLTAELRQFDIDCLVKAGKKEDAVKLLVESRNSDNPKLQSSKWSEQLIGFYESLGRQEEYRRELEYYTTNCTQFSLDYIKKLKSVVPVQEWPALRDRILAGKFGSGYKSSFLLEEKMYSELLDNVILSDDMSGFYHYLNVLKKELPFETRDALLLFLDSHIGEARSGNAYSEFASMLKKVSSFPDGKVLAENMAKQWVERFPRRSTLRRELENSGLIK